MLASLWGSWARSSQRKSFLVAQARYPPSAVPAQTASTAAAARSFFHTRPFFFFVLAPGCFPAPGAGPLPCAGRRAFFPCCAPGRCVRRPSSGAGRPATLPRAEDGPACRAEKPSNGPGCSGRGCPAARSAASSRGTVPCPPGPGRPGCCALRAPVGGAPGARPVSYTHLDVYKRQRWNSPLKRSSTCRLSAAPPACRLCKANRISFCSFSERSDLFSTNSGSKRMPPPFPLAA